MSKAYKCDKCGDLCEDAKSCNIHGDRYSQIALNFSYTKFGDPIDLCVHCEVKVMEDTLEFLKGCLPITYEEDLIGNPRDQLKKVPMNSTGTNYTRTQNDDINDSYDVDPHVNDAYDNDEEEE